MKILAIFYLTTLLIVTLKLLFKAVNDVATGNTDSFTVSYNGEEKSSRGFFWLFTALLIFGAVMNSYLIAILISR